MPLSSSPSRPRLSSNSTTTPKAIKRPSVGMQPVPFPTGSESPGLTTSFSDARSNSAHQGVDESRSFANTPIQVQLRGHEAEIYPLSQEVLNLNQELNDRPTVEAMERLRSEWQTSEELFDQSQRDNEQKQKTIETLRTYIKALEGKLEETIGEDWKDFCALPTVNPPSNTFTASTPLPKPGLRSAASIKRANRHSRTASASDPAFARSLREMDSVRESTTIATTIRKLEGIQELGTPPGQLVHPPPSVSSVNRPLPSEIVNSLADNLSSPLRTESRPHHGFGSQPDSAEQIASLLTSMQSLPASLLSQLETKRLQNEEQDLVKRKVQQDAIAKLLDEAEQRAQDREIRLQTLLAEVNCLPVSADAQAKTCSAQMH